MVLFLSFFGDSKTIFIYSAEVIRVVDGDWCVRFIKSDVFDT